MKIRASCDRARIARIANKRELWSHVFLAPTYLAKEQSSKLTAERIQVATGRTPDLPLLERRGLSGSWSWDWSIHRKPKVLLNGVGLLWQTWDCPA